MLRHVGPLLRYLDSVACEAKLRAFDDGPLIMYKGRGDSEDRQAGAAAAVSASRPLPLRAGYSGEHVVLQLSATAADSLQCGYCGVGVAQPHSRLADGPCASARLCAKCVQHIDGKWACAPCSRDVARESWTRYAVSQAPLPSSCPLPPPALAACPCPASGDARAEGQPAGSCG